jgi:hypothetical protein
MLTADHDSVIVADIVGRVGPPWPAVPIGAHRSRRRELELRRGGEEIVLDPASFCRIVSGRPGPDGVQPWGLLTTQVPF